MKVGKEKGKRGEFFRGRNGLKKKGKMTSLMAQRSHMARLCLYSLTSRRRALQTQTVERLQLERGGSRLLTETSLH